MIQILIGGSRGWTAICLDRHHSRITSNEMETYGCVPYPFGSKAEFIDNSACLLSISDSSRRHPALPDVFPATYMSSSVSTMIADLESFDEIEDHPFQDEIDDGVSDETTEESDSTETSVVEVVYTSSSISATNQQIDPKFYGTSPEQSPYSSKESWNHLPCNILMTSETDILLLDNPYSSIKVPQNSLHQGLLCRKLLHQQIPHAIPMLKHIERLNMVHQIPELGIVAIGDQAGRVALLTMTYWPGKNRYGFKVEAIVPYMSEEDKGMRPEVPLLGMAISPVQGQGSRPYSPSNMTPNREPQKVFGLSRRYRLLMMYYDQTMLSYEISRPVDSGELLIF